MALKICAIGCGSMAAKGHGPAFRKYAAEHPDTELTACCDVDAARAARFCGEFGFLRAYTDYGEMLRAEKPDAVSLMAPVHLTARMAIDLLACGYPTILEKPPGLDAGEARAILEAALRAGTPHQVAFNRRHMPLVRRFLECRREEHVHCWQYDFYRVGRQDEDFSTTAIHGIDTLRFLAGCDYRRVDFSYLRVPGCAEQVTDLFLDAEFTDGSMARLVFCPMSGILAEGCLAHASESTIEAKLPVWGSHDGEGSLVWARKGEIVLAEAPAGVEGFVANGFYGENEAFFEGIRAGRAPRDDAASGLQSVEIMECIRRRAARY